MAQEVINQEERNEVVYQVAGNEVKLSPNIIHQFITKGNGEITKAEAVNFIQLCRYAELNPFLNEAYLIKFGNQPAQMITAKVALEKRAARQPDYRGIRSGVIVFNKDEQVSHKKGAMLYPGETLLGAWAEVKRGDFEEPIYVEVAFEEYNTGKSTWAKMPANMINKVAEAAALRKAYPEQLGGMYTEDEPSVHELKEAAVIEEKSEKTNELLSGFKQEDEVVIDAETIESE